MANQVAMPQQTMGEENMGRSARARPLGTLDILREIGNQVCNRQDILNLCLVDKTFNEVFSEFLYKELEFCERNRDWLSDEGKSLLLYNNENLKHVRQFTFCVYADRDLNQVDAYDAARFPSECCQTTEWCIRANRVLFELIEHMPRLESFTWLGYPLVSEGLRWLRKNCKLLTHVKLVYPENLDLRFGFKDDSDHDIMFSPDSELWNPLRPVFVPVKLPQFKNLQQLHLHHIWGGTDLPKWRDMIVAILLRSPCLVDLGLSMSVSTRCRQEDRFYTSNGEEPHPASFLMELCELYRKQGGKPLALRSLHLGHFMFTLRSGPDQGHLRPAFPEEHQNGGHLDLLVDMSTLVELSMDLIGDDSFDLLTDEFYWPTAPGPVPNLQKLSVRMPTTWFARWAKKEFEAGAPLTQIRVNEAATLGSGRYQLSGARRSDLAMSWTGFLDCRPRELMFFGGDGWYNCRQAFDKTTACDSIRYLAMTSPYFSFNLPELGSRMPQLEGLWIMNVLTTVGGSLRPFYRPDRGGFGQIQLEKAEWEAELREVLPAFPNLKFFRMTSITWRIERNSSGVVLHELDRMGNETEVPDLFRISVPYMFNEAHSAKFWVNDRARDDDELI
ncbi:hypothetical protein F5Y13DRAFT_194648 [Hypoxylon sp. FL1857]|nr:hypothetical protein F5Y13DRAFT_194648 [Hypoxylon sp. FL1857]